MQEKTTEKSNISASVADRLIAAHDGDAALLYIYLARNPAADLDRAAHDLCRTMREVADAEEKLRRMALLPIPGRAALPSQSSSAPKSSQTAPETGAEDRLPQYRSEDIVRRSKSDGGFSVVLDEAAKVIGRPLNSNDMRVLFGVYDYLALPAEVILELLNYCAELYTEKFGSSRRPSARAIEKEAYAWARQEIISLEQAEAFIRRQKARRGDEGRMKAALGIHGRELTATEAKYISSWLDMGFDEEAAAIAYDRTVTNTGSLKWPYMNKILTRWHESGLHSPKDIEEKDSRCKPGVQIEKSGGAAIDMEKLRRAMEKI